MSKTVIGVFSREDSAKQAVQDLRNSGFDTNRSFHYAVTDSEMPVEL